MYSYLGNTCYPVILGDEAHLDGFLDCKFILTLRLPRFVCHFQLSVFHCHSSSVCILLITVIQWYLSKKSNSSGGLVHYLPLFEFEFSIVYLKLSIYIHTKFLLLFHLYQHLMIRIEVIFQTLLSYYLRIKKPNRMLNIKYIINRYIKKWSFGMFWSSWFKI